MPNLLLTAEPGLLGAEPGNLEPGGPGAPRPAPFLPAGQTYPYIAHLFTQGGGFKKLGLGKLLNYPTLSAQQNGGQAAITLELPAQDTSANAPVQGDIIKITQQGGDGQVLYTGIIEDLPDDLDITIRHAIDLVPLVAELDLAPITVHYNTQTDVAQMFRDAIAVTDHLFVTPQSCPDSGVTGIGGDLVQVNALQVVDLARKIGGVNFYYHIDAIGCGWFGQVNMAAPATHTVKRGVDYQSRKYKSPVAKLKNHIPVNGGIAPGTSAPMFSLYHNATSILQYGTRALFPGPTYDNITDQATLDAIKDTLGAGLDRQITRVELSLNNFSSRIDIKRGATLRYWEPNKNTQQESTTGSGTYSPTFVVLETHVTGPNQQIVVSDMVASGLDDFQYEIARIMARTSIANLTYVPASLNIKGQINGGGIQTSGSGTARWIIDDASIRGEDGTQTDHGAGPGVTAAIKADGSFFGSNILLQSAAAGARWMIDHFSIRGVNGTATDYGAGPGVTALIGADGSAFFQNILLQTFGSGARMVLDSTVPSFKIIDSSGVTRAELGNLGTSGVSAAGYKFRASNASNVPIFDSDGLIAVMQPLAATSFGITSVSTAGTSTFADVPGSSASFSLARPSRVLVFAHLNAGDVSQAFARTVIDGSYVGGTVPGFSQLSNFENGSIVALGGVLAAGSHTATIQASTSGGGDTLSVYDGDTLVFLLGG